MQGPIAQAAALTIYGNRRLAGPAPADFWPGASVFKFCKEVRFVTLANDRPPFVETPFAADPAKWLEALAGSGVQSLRLHHVPGNHPLMNDRLSVAFAGGGGRWLIETVSGDRADLWEAKWSLGDRKDPERRIWSVSYGRVQAEAAPVALQERSLVSLRDDLKAALLRAEAFASVKELDGFAAAFRDGAALLSSAEPLAGCFHRDIAPGGAIPLEARQLLAATETGWVFGGMGSWNDLSYQGPDRQEYEELSDRLFDLMVEAIATAANASRAPSDGASSRPVSVQS